MADQKNDTPLWDQPLTQEQTATIKKGWTDNLKAGVSVQSMVEGAAPPVLILQDGMKYQTMQVSAMEEKEFTRITRPYETALQEWIAAIKQRKQPTLKRFAELLQCQEEEFFCSDREQHRYDHWCGLEVSREFLDYSFQIASLAHAFHAYLNGLSQKEREERRQRFDAMVEGRRWKQEFDYWVWEKIAPPLYCLPSSEVRAQYLTCELGKYPMAHDLGPAVPQALKDRFREAEAAGKAYREWKQQHRVVMMCELIPESPTIREHYRCWVEERERVPNPALDAMWERMKGQLEEALRKRGFKVN